MATTRPHRRAFTLVEALAAAAILAFVVAAIAHAIVAGQMHTAQALHDLRGSALAEALMEEVLALPYVDPDGASAPGPEVGETARALFDNADDFHGFTESAGAVRDAAGALYPDVFQRFSRGVTAAYGSTAAGALGSVTGLTVSVTVTDARGGAWTLVRFIPEGT